MSLAEEIRKFKDWADNRPISREAIKDGMLSRFCLGLYRQEVVSASREKGTSIGSGGQAELVLNSSSCWENRVTCACPNT